MGWDLEKEFGGRVKSNLVHEREGEKLSVWKYCVELSENKLLAGIKRFMNRNYNIMIT